MNTTLNQLALLSFTRKAKKLKTVIFKQVINEFDLYEQIQDGSIILLWSEENGFSQTQASALRYVSLEMFDKYKNDIVTHFGIYHPSKPFITVRRCCDDNLLLGLKEFINDLSYTETMQEESDRVSSMTATGNGSWA
jgi:hypothetical protein